MTDARRWLVAAVLAAFCSAPLAEAAVTTVTVTDQNGQAVAGASVSLGTLTGTTDASGRATFSDVPAGSYDLSVAGDGLKTNTRKVSVGATDTAVAVTVVPFYAWMTQMPGFGGLGVGPSYEGTFADVDIRKSRLRDFVGNTVFPVDPVPDFRRFDYSLRLNEALVDVPIGLPSWSIAPRLRLDSAVHVALGGNSVELEQDGPGSAHDTTLKGSGFSWGAGAEIGVSFPAQGKADWLEDFYLRVGYRYRDGSADVERSPGGSETAGFNPVPPATARLGEDGDLDWYSHTGFAHVGYSFWSDRVTPYVGLQYQYRKMNLETSNRVEVGGGLPVTRKVSQEFRYSDWMGVVGVDARPFGSLSKCLDSLFLRSEVQFGSNAVGVQVKLIYHFDLWDE